MARPNEGWKLRAPTSGCVNYTVRFRFNGRDYERSTGTADRDAALVEAERIYVAVLTGMLPEPPPRPPLKPRFVYLLRGTLTGRIKIGSARDVGSRVETLRTGSAERLELLVSIPFSEVTEGELHERFAAARLHGEWFRPSVELVAFIEERTGRPAA